MENHAYNLAEKLWHYHRLNHTLEKADVILVLCSHDKRVAERGAELFLEGWAPLLIYSGGFGAITKGMWAEPEAKLFADIAIKLGVPEEKILIESESTNTGENVLFTRKLLEEKGLQPQKFIVAQKPYMERRSYATFRQMWDEKELIVTSPQTTFAEYLENYSNPGLTRDDVIGIMVGDLQRIKLYPAKGFQIHQEIPDKIWAAYEELVSAGYNKYLISP